MGLTSGILSFRSVGDTASSSSSSSSSASVSSTGIVVAVAETVGVSVLLEVLDSVQVLFFQIPTAFLACITCFFFSAF